ARQRRDRLLDRHDRQRVDERTRRRAGAGRAAAPVGISGSPLAQAILERQKSRGADETVLQHLATIQLRLDDVEAVAACDLQRLLFAVAGDVHFMEAPFGDFSSSRIPRAPADLVALPLAKDMPRQTIERLTTMPPIDQAID